MVLLRRSLALALVGAALAIMGCKPSRGEETVDCTPGAHIWVGCNQACSIGECSGDPWLQICDGDTPVASCVEGSFIAQSDDSTELCFSTCPIVQMVCPESGHITVTLKGYSGSSSAFTCDWRVDERPPLTLRDAGTPSTDAGGSS
ncbi:hypothetical protein [Sandaracinus amylolyticus]|uniref:hypothetical protein n=1 Tax=Sandaracinus amylolyticus TaxID=927083 RepID=UPI001F27DC94|nr:hypothetical protein [Sandaracinus amylolyticus]UJR82182.1 Hypothetical protein I5071_42470 [Sandaracinus amylolyticus]